MQDEWSQGKGARLSWRGPLGEGAFLQPLWGDPACSEVGFGCPEPAWQGHRGWDGV